MGTRQRWWPQVISSEQSSAGDLSTPILRPSLPVPGAGSSGFRRATQSEYQRLSRMQSGCHDLADQAERGKLHYIEGVDEFGAAMALVFSVPR